MPTIYTVSEIGNWIYLNAIWAIPLALFVFISAVIGFWKLIGRFFFTKKKPQDQPPKLSLGDSIEDSNTMPGENLTSPLVPVDEGMYLDLTSKQLGIK